MDAGQFLTELWGERPPGQVLVWRMPSKRSTWYFDMTKVSVGGYTSEDVYTGVGLAPQFCYNLSLEYGRSMMLHVLIPRNTRGAGPTEA